jgi:hypothetical protein
VVDNDEMRGGESVKNREEAEKRLSRMRNMKETDKIAFLLEMMVDLLMDIRFGEKKVE